MIEYLCPYCLVRPCDSLDHIFPDFLGGTRKIDSCRHCNSTFGHGFEAKVYEDLKPFIIRLRLFGYRHSRRVVLQRAWIDEKGVEYDLDSNLRLFPSSTHRVKRDGKKVTIRTRTLEEAHKILAGFQAKKGEGQLILEELDKREEFRPQLGGFKLWTGKEIRQVAVKTCIALGQLIFPSHNIIDEEIRTFLLDKQCTSQPVRQMFFSYPGLDQLRQPLAHTVYIEGNAISGRSFGVFQLFGGCVQFYVPLSCSYQGADFGAIGSLNITNFEEQFGEIPPLRLPEAPSEISREEYALFLAEWGDEFSKEVHAALGRSDKWAATPPDELMLS